MLHRLIFAHLGTQKNIKKREKTLNWFFLTVISIVIFSCFLSQILPNLSVNILCHFFVFLPVTKRKIMSSKVNSYQHYPPAVHTSLLSKESKIQVFV